MLTRIARWILPAACIKSLQTYHILSKKFGHYRSLTQRECVDGVNSPIPWYTYPAIEYVKQLDFSDKVIFEFGSGNSTLFWAKRAKTVYSVESDPQWYGRMKALMPTNVEYMLREQAESYASSIRHCSQKFDLIIIDGLSRYKCAAAAIGMLSESGMIILDNADWYGESAKLLRSADLIEVDMAGFGPIMSYPWVTSFFFSREYRYTTLTKKQPDFVLGGKHYVMDVVN
jgi:hypothetical protein